VKFVVTASKAYRDKVVSELKAPRKIIAWLIFTDTIQIGMLGYLLWRLHNG